MLLGFLESHHHSDTHAFLVCILAAAAFGSANVEADTCRKVLNNIGALTCGSMLFQWRTLRGVNAVAGIASHKAHTPLWPFIEERICILIGASFFTLLEVDRVNAQARMQEALQLSCMFHGIADATCSKAADRERIVGEIGDKTADVDHAIDVLLAAGMSTPTLRELSRAGVDIHNAGHAEVAVPFVAIVTSLITFCRLATDILYESNPWYIWLLGTRTFFMFFPLLGNPKP